jgi:hypothetical protein
MKPFIWVAAVLLLSMTSTVAAKNATMGIYAVIDEVRFESEGSSPNLIRISGVFIVPKPLSSGEYVETPQRGFLYFRIPAGMEKATLREWADLKPFAGTGRPVGFAEYWVANPNDPHGNPHRSLEVDVHNDGEPASPEVCPRFEGIIKTGGEHDPNYNRLAALLRKAVAIQPVAVRRP